MDIQARKISIIQELLRINSEELINKLDKFLHDEKKKIYEKELKPMSLDSFNDMIDKAEDDSVNGRIVEAKILKKDIENPLDAKPLSAIFYFLASEMEFFSDNVFEIFQILKNFFNNYILTLTPICQYCYIDNHLLQIS
jgi:hypothetical protein